METLGARRASTIAALGPMISQSSYEVDAEFADRFIAASTGHVSFFSASARDGHFMFDLPGLISMRLRLAGIDLFEDLARDTYAEPEIFFSYRRCVHRNEPDYGRHIAAIALI
jgi:copper oxidase (laccase) domain-containing protein